MITVPPLRIYYWLKWPEIGLLLAFDSHDVLSRRVYIVHRARVSLNDVECMTMKTGWVSRMFRNMMRNDAYWKGLRVQSLVNIGSLLSLGKNTYWVWPIIQSKLAPWIQWDRMDHTPFEDPWITSSMMSLWLRTNVCSLGVKSLSWTKPFAIIFSKVGRSGDL